jgi:hypothetical protein
MRSIKTLLKDYDLNSDMQYFEMIVLSVINGQRTQAKELFNIMPRKDRKAFIVAVYSNWISGLSDSDKAMFLKEL